MSSRVRVPAVTPLKDRRVRLEFTNGEVREMDLAPYLHGPIFEPVRADDAAFRAVRVDADLGTVVWPNGADIDPDVLYEGLMPAWRTASDAA